ncbi:hypothetical protein MNBD_GAMMA16-2061 [hydrothermal vent metagenome]|uniref:2-isopropylmalate synthase LeuA allosteric (dimerisation) domain-containing protein n=1 Tax=hydrothermal vent metagenome TaxID=652676 RepID=A0A3B0ZBJ8_9ZZZZ
MAELVQQVSETRGGVIDSETIYQIFMNHFVQDQTPVMLNGYSLNNEGSRDVVELRIDIEGVAQKIEGKGEGVIAAFINAWNHHSSQQINVMNYNEHAADEGSKAKAITYIQLDVEGTLVSGAALDYDTVKASLKAVISALNRGL